MHRLAKALLAVKPFLKNILCLTGHRLTHSGRFCISADTNRRQKKRGVIAPLLVSYRLAVGVALSAGAGNVLLLSCCASLLGVLLYCFPSSISSFGLKIAIVCYVFLNI